MAWKGDNRFKRRRVEDPFTRRKFAPPTGQVDGTPVLPIVHCATDPPFLKKKKTKMAAWALERRNKLAENSCLEPRNAKFLRFCLFCLDSRSLCHVVCSGELDSISAPPLQYIGGSVGYPVFLSIIPGGPACVSEGPATYPQDKTREENIGLDREVDTTVDVCLVCLSEMSPLEGGSQFLNVGCISKDCANFWQSRR
ncbi:hypothetical protein Bbelb_152490 [Branchiostoma belcheri]|nr:hypothetical protein Bbelb_152490 [Branchiostoma belcheri]